MILTSTEPIFFTEIDDDEPDIDRGTQQRQINVEELNNLMTTCDVKDLIEDDLTVDSIQNNKTQSILIDDVFEDDRSLSNDRDNINEPEIENMKLSSIDVESASTEPVHDLENEQNEKGLLIDTKHKMSRQRSDLSENIKISSTPEAERYFARKNKTMGERYEKGELDIEVVSVDNKDEEQEE